MDKAIREGDGQIGHDLHPDSLLLRWLADGPPPELAGAYRPHAGQLGFRTEVALKAIVPAVRAAAKKIVNDRLKQPVWIRDAVLARIDTLQLSPEMTEGDGVVSKASATAVGKDAKTWDRQHHLSLTGIEEIVKEAQALLK
ncbi:MAG TPA: hypothetical protein VJU16_03710 [Planctomycetota bacterium]|nr:hypothetical protein [Planctomycetota bacterium]